MAGEIEYSEAEVDEHYETELLGELALFDLEDRKVVSFNYIYERHHEILTIPIRTKFIKVLKTIRDGGRLSAKPRAYNCYKDTIYSESEFWLTGKNVELDRPLVMVKHGNVIYREQWSFLSGLPEEPEDKDLASALGDNLGEVGAALAEQRALRTGAATEAQLFEKLDYDPIREMINIDLENAGLGKLNPDESKSWNSHGKYHDNFMSDGYIPIWWVTTKRALLTELAGQADRVQTAAIALGLSSMKPGPYYIVEVPSQETEEWTVFKPTILSGGFPDNYCAFQSSSHPGATARLGSGNQGLPEAIMAPLPPNHDAEPGVWPKPTRLGTVFEVPPRPNVERIRQRLAI